MIAVSVDAALEIERAILLHEVSEHLSQLSLVYSEKRRNLEAVQNSFGRMTPANIRENIEIAQISGDTDIFVLTQMLNRKLDRLSSIALAMKTIEDAEANRTDCPKCNGPAVNNICESCQLTVLDCSCIDRFSTLAENPSEYPPSAPAIRRPVIRCSFCGRPESEPAMNVHCESNHKEQVSAETT